MKFIIQLKMKSLLSYIISFTVNNNNLLFIFISIYNPLLCQANVIIKNINTTAGVSIETFISVLALHKRLYNAKTSLTKTCIFMILFKGVSGL